MHERIETALHIARDHIRSCINSGSLSDLAADHFIDNTDELIELLGFLDDILDSE